MTMKIPDWNSLLSLVNADKDLSKDNVIDKIQNELKRHSKEYEEWEKAGFDINYVFKDGEKMALLHLAVSCNSENIANALIEKGANVNEKGANGETPLHEIAYFGNINIAKTLIESGANINEKDKNGETPLHLAARFVRLDLLRILIEAKACVGVKDESGRTPLHSAVVGDREEVVDAVLEIIDALLKAGANSLLQDKYGKNPKDVARSYRAPDSIRKLLKEAENKQLMPATKDGVIAGSSTALLGTAMASALFATGTITIELMPMVMAVAAIPTAALAVGGATYMLLKPSTKVDEVEKPPVLMDGRQESVNAALQ